MVASASSSLRKAVERSTPKPITGFGHPAPDGGPALVVGAMMAGGGIALAVGAGATGGFIAGAILGGLGLIMLLIGLLARRSSPTSARAKAAPEGVVAKDDRPKTKPMPTPLDVPQAAAVSVRAPTVGGVNRAA